MYNTDKESYIILVNEKGVFMIQNDKTKGLLRIVGGFVVATLLNLLLFYVMLPPINIYSKGFWFFLMLVLIIYGAVMGAFNLGKKKRTESANFHFKGRAIR